MAVKIRLKRLGRKKKAVYRLVVASESSPRDGKIVEEVGFYNPLLEPIVFNYEEERIKYWLGVGAKPTEAVERLLSKVGMLKASIRKSPFAGQSKKQRKEVADQKAEQIETAKKAAAAAKVEAAKAAAEAAKAEAAPAA
jgi:small subunit ribosomal protein S16